MLRKYLRTPRSLITNCWWRILLQLVMAAWLLLVKIRSSTSIKTTNLSSDLIRINNEWSALLLMNPSSLSTTKSSLNGNEGTYKAKDVIVWKSNLIFPCLKIGALLPLAMNIWDGGEFFLKSSGWLYLLVGYICWLVLWSVTPLNLWHKNHAHYL